MTSEVLIVEDRGPIRVITLNRPERGNSLDARLGKALLETVRETAHSHSVRAVLRSSAPVRASTPAMSSPLQKT